METLKVVKNLSEGAVSRPSMLAQRWRWVVVLVLFASVVIGFIDRISIAVLFTNPDFYTSIGTGFNPEKLGMLMTVFVLAYGVSAMLLSFVGDMFGPSRLLGILTALWGLMMWWVGSATSFMSMACARVALGVTEGPGFSLISKIVHRWFPARERGRANAVWMVGSPIGSAVGFPLSIWLVHAYGWRASLFVLGVVSTLVMAPLIFMITRDREHLMPRQPAVAAHEHGGRAPFLKDPKFWLVTLYGCGLLMYLWGLNSWLPTYLERERHFNLREMGIYSSLPFVLMFIGEMASGWLSDRLGKKAILCAIGLFFAGILLYVATAIKDPHIAAIVIALSAGSWGLGLPAQIALSMEILPGPVVSSGIGVQNGVSNLFGAAAPALIGWIVGHTGNFQAGLMVIVFSSIVGALVILPLVREH
jgi:sugar phosphate permease